MEAEAYSIARRIVRSLTAFAGVILLAGCGAKAPTEQEVGATHDARAIGQPLKVKVPLGLPPLLTPKDNPVTAEAVALGRRLFYDPRLSVDNTIACANCHNPSMGFSDGRRVSTGFGGKFGVRNAPTILNATYNKTQFWDGRAPSLEEQAAGPIANPVEMNHSFQALVPDINKDPSYQLEFNKVFGPGAITLDKIEKALASFERTALSGNSPFDRYQFGHDAKAMSPAAVRGFALFINTSKGNCIQCHVISKNSALFSDGLFHNLGVGVDGEGNLKDLGRYEVTHKEPDKGAFKTPILRNIAQTAPYMHDGSLKTLAAVVDFYTGGGNSNDHLDKNIKALNLTGKERADLVSFLESLTGEIPPDLGPPSPGPPASSPSPSSK